jgi:serine/threonine protein phosphatase PrpC
VVRDQNEDAVLSRPEFGLWTVSDGMGGHRQGELASSLTVGRLADIGLHGSGYGLLSEVRQRLEAVNQELIALAAADGGAGPIGATVVTLMAFEEHFACLWAGDSRAYILRCGRRIERITRDHTLTQRLLDSGECGARPDELARVQHVITRALGVTSAIQLDLANGMIAAGDRLLLCSDGLTDIMSDDDLAAVIGHGDLEQSADRLLHAALGRHPQDNVSFVLIHADG